MSHSWASLQTSQGLPVRGKATGAPAMAVATCSDGFVKKYDVNKKKWWRGAVCGFSRDLNSSARAELTYPP